MNLKLLKKDLQRKKSMNFILLIFVLLASMFISSSGRNMQVTWKGTDRFFELAGLLDYFILTLDDESTPDNTQSLLEENPYVEQFTEDTLLFISRTNLELSDGTNPDMSSTMILSSYAIEQQVFFDENNNIITDMEDGTIYISPYLRDDNDIKIGDMLKLVTKDGYEKEFKVCGMHKDALLGSMFMGSHRLLFSENDYAELMEESKLSSGKLFSARVNDLKSFERIINQDPPNAILSDSIEMVRTSYVMDTIIAAILLLVSICLILISAVMLRFLIIFTVNEDYTEIGIMKALGIPTRSIRSIYLMKYALISIVGSLLGLLLGLPFAKLLLRGAEENLVLEDSTASLVLSIVASTVTALLIILFAYISTRKIKKMTPMDAIRKGNKGERFHKKGKLSMKNSRRRVTTFLAANDILSELRKYIVVIIIGILGMWLVIMPANTINTLRSDKIHSWFGMQACDLWISEDETCTELVVEKNRQKIYDYIQETRQKLTDHDIPVKDIYFELMYSLKLRFGNTSLVSTTSQGIGADTEGYAYLEGHAPVLANELALTHVMAEKLGATIGDTVFVTIGAEEKPFLVTALYESMMSMGDGVRFPEITQLDENALSGCFGAQVVLEDGLSEAEKRDFLEKVKDIYPPQSVQTMKQFIEGLLGSIATRLDFLKVLIGIIVVTINIMVVVLIQKMFFIRERGEIGMLKAIGFPNRSIILWQTKRMLYALVFGIILGGLTGTPFTSLTAGPVFNMMGASSITFDIKPLEIYVLYPALIILAVILSCILTMRSVKKIDATEINDIE